MTDWKKRGKISRKKGHLEGGYIWGNNDKGGNWEENRSEEELDKMIGLSPIMLSK